MKHLKTLLTTIVVLLCSVTMNAHDFEVDGIYYNITSATDLTVSVTYKGSDSYSAVYSGDIVIPSSVSYNGNTYSVTSVGLYAFRACSALTKVSIPNSVTEINGQAFEFAEYIMEIEDNVRYFESWALGVVDKGKTSYKLRSGTTRMINGLFKDCVNSQIIELPSTVENISYGAFQGCCDLTTVSIPQNIISIGDCAFDGCSSLPSFSIPSGVTNIGWGAFRDCTNLSSITIPSSVTNIGMYAFQGCTNLSSITIPSSVTNIGERAFERCTGLSSITIPENVVSIEGYAFAECTSLPVENNIRYAGTWAIGVTDNTLPRYILRSNTRGLFRTFSGCSLMTRVTLPDSLRNIGDNAFYGCSSIKNLTLPSGVNYIGSSAFSGCSSLASLTIPDGVTAIGSSTFYGCSALTSMIIPDNVESLGASLFYNCHNLSSVTLPKGLTKIENSTFYGCNLSDFEMPESVTSIGTYAFYDNPLSAIVIPSAVTSIGDYAFSNCYNLDTVTINSTDIMANGKFSNVFGENITNYNIGGNIKELADFAFFNYQKIKKITLPESLETIGESAFESCVNLDSVTLPKNVANIGAYAFASCTALKSVVSNNPVPPVCGEEAFYEVETANCSLEVPDSVVSLYSETAPWSDFNIVGVVIPTAMALVDGEVYDNKKELAMDSITYTRTFNNTNWQALYVPFAMNYEDWSADFDVAKINDIHQFDINGDGDFSDEGVDKTIMEMLIVNSGSLKPNHPYMIRAKAKGQKTITVKNAVLMPAQSKSIDCSSVEQKYVFTGTYNVIDGETMVAGKYYAMSGGSVKYTSSTANSLKPFRWYMQIQNRDGQVIQDVSEVKVAVRGEDDWDATGIDEIDTEENIYTIYSVDGRAIRSIKATTIEEATQGIASGMYIINGKKHFVK